MHLCLLEVLVFQWGRNILLGEQIPHVITPWLLYLFSVISLLIDKFIVGSYYKTYFSNQSVYFQNVN